MRKCILAASVISIGLLGACSQTEKTEDTKATAVAKEETETVVPKEWKDLTVANDIIEGPQSAKEFISMYDESFNANVENAFNQRTEDDLSTIEYYYYEESISLDNSLLDLPIVVEGESIEKDFKNMESLSYIIKGEQAKF